MDVGVNYEGALFICDFMDVGVNYDGTLFICETSWMRGLIMKEHCLFVRLHGCGG